MNQPSGIIKKLFRTSVISIILAAMAAMLGVVIDGIVIGRFLGSDSMAAYSLVTPIVNLATAFSGILAAGAQVICAQRLGAGDKKGARTAFSMCMIMTAIISVVFIAVLFFFRDGICVMLGARGNSAHLLPLASDYLLGMMFSIPSVLLLFEFNALMRLDGDANRVIVAVAVMTVLDIAGDIINALVLHWGMLGMGLATTISYAVALVIMLLHFAKKNIIFKFSFKHLSFRDTKEILVTGSSSAMGSACTMLRNAVLNQIMIATALSSIALAALGVLNTVLNFVSCTMIGIGMTAAMIAGMILGEQDRSAARELVKVTIQTVVLIGSVLAVILFFSADLIAGVFKGDNGEKMVELAARGLRIYAFSVLLYGFNNAFINYTQGMRRMALSNIFCFLQNFVFIVIPALALSGVLETDAVWFSFLIGESLTLLSILILAAVKKRGIAYRVDDFLFLKEPFGVKKENLFEASVTKKEEIVLVSEAIGAFCEEKHATAKEKLLLSLFVEELCMNIVNYGFQDKKNHSIDIRVIRMDDGFVLRVRDNCRLFDPTEWIKLHESDDPTANIGIRMVCHMAKDVRYLSTMDLNNLTIRI